jgi:sugar (pentulose or hexulose) kinase
MPIVLGVDLGTTKITAAALDTETGDVIACHSAPNRAEKTSPADKACGHSEWDARQIAEIGAECLRGVAEQIRDRSDPPIGLGITGQQHGVVLLDDRLSSLTPLVNWQDRRANLPFPGSSQTYVQRAVALVGKDAPRRAGCRLAAGYLGVTLFWLKEAGRLPPGATACSIMDYFGAVVTARPPVTDATCAAASGLLDVAAGDWDRAAIHALGLSPEMFPPVRPSGELLGGLTRAMAEATCLPVGLPVFVGIGDNQASFLGSVGDPVGAVLVNVGTGGQVAVLTDQFAYDPLLETRPFPRGGFLLVAAGLCGGSSYAALERFFRQIGTDVFGVKSDESLYESMNRLAADVPAGADGLDCEPFFTGTRARPGQRASIRGASATNFSPGHLTRAVLEGMARTFRDGYDRITRHTGRPSTRLVGAGNGLRENAVLARIVADAFEMSMRIPRHREEAAYGAALMAAVGAGVFADVGSAGRLIHHQAQ